VTSKLTRNLILAPVILVVLFELVCWIFVRFPAEPMRILDLNNEIPGFKTNVRLVLGNDQVRYLGWTPGEKPAGAVRILCTGGWATLGMLQSEEDTWWGRLHAQLKQRGLNVETAARGFERTGIISVATAMAPVIERLQPDVLILNAGFDDVIVHSAVYTYDKDKLAKRPASPPPSALKAWLRKYSQSARFKSWWSKDSEAKKMQNELGRKDVYKRHFEEKRKLVQSLPRHEGILRRHGTNDPLPEYLDGLAAFRDMAAKCGASLILTGEASLHDSFMHLTQDARKAEGLLLAYIALREPEPNGNVAAARPDPAWVLGEMERFAGAAEKFAAENNLPWFDLNGKVARSTENFFSDVLLTDAGAAEAATLLLPVVEPVVRAKAK
jgi:hypothetical protein